MKKEYISPELDVVRFRLVDVLVGSPTDSVPIQDGGGDDLPGAGDELGGDL